MMTEAARLKHFDIIEGLHIRYMNNILEAIFKFLDSESLRNAELTCKTWKAAVSDINPNKLWQMLLHKKISTSPLWKRLNYCLKSKLPPKDYLSSRNLFSKIEFTVKALQNNWLENDLTREYVDCDVGLQSCVFQMRNKFIALWEPISGIFKIWDRITLKVEEVYSGPPHQPDLDYELYEDALIYSMKDYIFIRNLTTKTTKVHKPLGSENKKWINCLRVDNGFLCVAAGVKGNDRNDVLIWKMKSPTEIEWKNPKIVPFVSMDNTRIFMDDKFIITAHYGTSYIFCDVYLMSSPQRKQKCLKFPRTRPELLYQDGFLLTVTVLDEIKIVDVETGKSKIIADIGADFSRHNNFLRIHSGYIFACTFVGCSHVGSQIQIWDFKKATEPTTKLPLKPFCSHHVFMEPAMILHVDAFGILAVNRELEFLNARDIIWTLNFLPICSFCKRVKKRLLKCASCKSAKYCSSICQKADWHHHRDLCRKIRDY